METYISKLNEFNQKTGFVIQYVEGSTEGPSHNKTFTCTAIINGTHYPDGTGKSKKDAKHNAARNAYNAITKTYNTQPITSTQNNLNNMSITPQTNYISWLNEYQQKNKITFMPRETTRMDPGNAQLCTYVCKYVCGDKEYPEACGKTKKEAKEAAAKCVYDELSLTQNTEAFDENCFNTESANLDRSSFAEDSRSTTSILDNNYKAYLNHYCQKNKCVLSFSLVEKRGPPHNPEFVYKAVINGKEYSEGHGKCKKEAQQHAAQNAWSELQQHSDGSTQSSEEDTSSHASEINKSMEALYPSLSSAATTSAIDSIVFTDSSGVGSSMAISAAKSPVDVRPKVKLAPSFNQSPIFSPKIKGNTKPSPHKTATQAIKSRFLEDFDAIERIGKGGFGRVFKARRKLENKFFAVKIVMSTDKALREVGALANLHHPNIVRYSTTWEEATTYRHDSSESTSDSGSSMDTKYLYIQMELCVGDTLRGWIEKRNSLKEDNITERRQKAEHICSQILHAVKCIHSKGLIHRDLKPANIMFGSEGGVKVGDFGLVTAAENDSDQQLLERTRRTGTRSYMSPEQLTQSYDRKVDIFALGLIYFELLWKLVTWTEKSKIWDDIRSRKFPPQFSIKFDFEHKLINKMLDPIPEERPDASELILKPQHNSKVLKNNEERPTEERPTEERPTEERPTEERPTEERPDASELILKPQHNSTVLKNNDMMLSQCFCEITQLGSGSFGCVFKARHKYDDKMYAVKRVELTTNADSEVKALAKLDHPNIVRYITCCPSFETWESYKDKSSQSSSSEYIACDGSDHDISGMKSLDTTSELYLFIQMDFCEGGTLTTWIEERNFMKKLRTTEEIYKIFYEIVSGVEYIHSNKLIHRDLKPDNIFFTAEGKVKIGDFGLVAPLMNPNGGSAYRSIGKGTPSYMSPEQENERHYDAKTDIFPLGLIWFEMLWKLSSGMERGKLWPDLRKQTFPEGFCHKHPNEYEFIRKMLSHTPQDRPRAKKIKENLDRFFYTDQNVLSQKTI